MADLSLAQGLIAAAQPRSATEDIARRKEKEGKEAFQTAFQVGASIAAPKARDIASGEFAADADGWIY